MDTVRRLYWLMIEDDRLYEFCYNRVMFYKCAANESNDKIKDLAYEISSLLSLIKHGSDPYGSLRFFLKNHSFDIEHCKTLAALFTQFFSK